MAITEGEYLRLERAAQFKSEYVDGEMFAMAGGTPGHSMLGVNTCAELRVQFRGKRCRVLSSDMRLRTPDGSQHYPDASVTCGAIQLYPGSNDILTNPVLLVEVLSPTTANYDRGSKFEMYRLIPSLADYLVIHQNSVFAEHHSKQPDGSWLLREYRGESACIPLPTIECELQLGNIYDGVIEEPA